MKVKQLDYSAMLNANQIMLASRNAGTQNTSLKFNKQNISAMESIYSLQKDAIKLNSEARSLSRGARIVNNILEAGVNIAKISGVFKQSIDAAEEAEANVDYTTIATQFGDTLNNLNNKGLLYSYDSGKPEYTDEYNQELTAFQAQIDKLGYSKDTSEAMKNALAQYGADYFSSGIQSRINQNAQIIAENRNTSYNDAIQAAIASGTRDTSGVDKLVDSWVDLSPEVKDYYKQQAARAIQTGDVQNKANLITDSSGYNDGKKYLDQARKNGEITQDEYDQMNAGIYTRHNRNLQMATKEVMDTVTQTFQTSGTVIDAYNAGMEVVNQAPEEDRETLEAEINKWQYSIFKKNNPWLENIEYMTPTELDEHYKTVDEDIDGYFTGMENTKKTVLYALKNQKDETETALGNAATKELSRQATEFKKSVGYWTSQLVNSDSTPLTDDNGNVIANDLNGSAYVRLLRAELETNYPELAQTQEGDKIVQDAINTMIHETIPGWYESDYKNLVNGILKNIKELDVDGTIDTAKLGDGIKAKVIDMLIDYGRNPWTDGQINQFLNSLNISSVGSILEELSKAGDIKIGGGYGEDTADISKYVSLLESTSHSEFLYTREGQDVSIDGGTVEGVMPQAKEAWDRLVERGEYVINTLVGEGTVDAKTARPINTDTYIPSYLGTDGKLYAVIPQADENGNIAQIISKSGNEEWKVLGGISSKGVYNSSEDGTPSEGVSLATGERTSYGKPSFIPNAYNDDDLVRAQNEAQDASSLADFISRETKNETKTPFTTAELIEVYYDPIYSALNEEYPKGEKSAKAIVDDLVENGTITREKANEFFSTGEWDKWFDKHNGYAAFAMPQTVERVVADESNMDYPDNQKIQEVLTESPANKVIESRDVAKVAEELESAREESKNYKDFLKKLKKVNVTQNEAESYYFYPALKILANHYEKGASVNTVLKNAGIDEKMIKEFYTYELDKWMNKWKSNPDSVKTNLWF